MAITLRFDLNDLIFENITNTKHNLFRIESNGFKRRPSIQTTDIFLSVVSQAFHDPDFELAEGSHQVAITLRFDLNDLIFEKITNTKQLRV